MIVRTAEEREGVIEAGKRFGIILEEVAKAVRPGITTRELDALAESLILAGGDSTPFKGYKPDPNGKPFPATTCISVNDEVVHGVPSDRVLKEGDIVKLDLGLAHKGFIMDSAVTVPVGTVPKKTRDLINATETALAVAIDIARPGARVGDISFAIQTAFAGTGFAVVKVLGGHGVGAEVHEEPFIGNTGHPGTGPEIVSGMVLALEPIANMGKASVFVAPDGFTFRTKDGTLSAHFEHTILVEDKETIILTKRPSE
jgi:methionyl aminopeptidase